MPTLSIPVSDETSEQIKLAIKYGQADSITEIGRKALNKYLEDLAVERVLKADKEPTLHGNLDELAAQI